MAVTSEEAGESHNVVKTRDTRPPGFLPFRAVRRQGFSVSPYGCWSRIGSRRSTTQGAELSATTPGEMRLVGAIRARPTACCLRRRNQAAAGLHSAPPARAAIVPISPNPTGSSIWPILLQDRGKLATRSNHRSRRRHGPTAAGSRPVSEIMPSHEGQGHHRKSAPRFTAQDADLLLHQMTGRGQATDRRSSGARGSGPQRRQGHRRDPEAHAEPETPAHPPSLDHPDHRRRRPFLCSVTASRTPGPGLVTERIRRSRPVRGGSRQPALFNIAKISIGPEPSERR